MLQLERFLNISINNQLLKKLSFVCLISGPFVLKELKIYFNTTKQILNKKIPGKMITSTRITSILHPFLSFHNKQIIYICIYVYLLTLYS